MSDDFDVGPRYPEREAVRLPDGTSVHVCAECGFDPPTHQYFCSGVEHYTRSQILREMVRVDDLLRQATTSTQEFLLRTDFWSWALWLGVDPYESRAVREGVRAAVDRERRRLVPPWKRRRKTA